MWADLKPSSLNTFQCLFKRILTSCGGHSNTHSKSTTGISSNISIFQPLQLSTELFFYCKCSWTVKHLKWTHFTSTYVVSMTTDDWQLKASVARRPNSTLHPENPLFYCNTKRVRLSINTTWRFQWNSGSYEATATIQKSPVHTHTHTHNKCEWLGGEQGRGLQAAADIIMQTCFLCLMCDHWQLPPVGGGATIHQTEGNNSMEGADQMIDSSVFQ